MKKLLLLLPLTLFASDTNNTKPLKEDASLFYFTKSCNSCHGIYGEGSNSAPKISGREVSEIVTRLKELQRGKVRTTAGTIMISFAQSLDENQTVLMAEYLSTLKKKEEERYEPDYDSFDDGSS